MTVLNLIRECCKAGGSSFHALQRGLEFPPVAWEVARQQNGQQYITSEFLIPPGQETHASTSVSAADARAKSSLRN